MTLFSHCISGTAKLKHWLLIICSIRIKCENIRQVLLSSLSNKVLYHHHSMPSWVLVVKTTIITVKELWLWSSTSNHFLISFSLFLSLSSTNILEKHRITKVSIIKVCAYNMKIVSIPIYSIAICIKFRKGFLTSRRFTQQEVFYNFAVLHTQMTVFNHCA